MSSEALEQQLNDINIAFNEMKTYGTKSVEFALWQPLLPEAKAKLEQNNHGWTEWMNHRGWHCVRIFPKE